MPFSFSGRKKTVDKFGEDVAEKSKHVANKENGKFLTEQFYDLIMYLNLPCQDRHVKFNLTAAFPACVCQYVWTWVVLTHTHKHVEEASYSFHFFILRK